jgi:hypothetical protein
MCSYCYTTTLQMMQNSSYSTYNDAYKSDYETVQSICSVTGATDIPPSVIVRAADPVPICASGENYTTSAGDTCDSIALASNIASAALFMGNSDIFLNCSSLDEGVELCLPLTCSSTYVLQSNDTCSSIETAQVIGAGKLRNYNSWISTNCSNLQIASEVYGNVLCLAPQAGTYTATAAVPGVTLAPSQDTGYTKQIIAAPVNSTVANGTTANCGKWHIAASGETCAMICTQEVIPSKLFLAVNPSLSTTDCTSSLVNGTTYCVGPTYGWNSGSLSETSISYTATSTSDLTGSPTATATVATSGTASPTATGSISQDGSCGYGSVSDATCLGSQFGDCCSEYGFCGSADANCGSGCQSDYGSCT